MATLFTFGCGSRGELGLPRADDRCRPEATAVAFPPEVPCKSSGEADITSIALGTDHSLSVVRGHVFRWGLLCTRSPPRWSSGSTSGGEVVPTPAPLAAWAAGQSGGDRGSDEQSFDGQVCSVTCGGSNSFMLTKDGEVFLFGDLRPPGGDAGRPRWLWGCPLKGPGERVAQVAAGWRHCLLLTEAGSLFALGDDEHGQCAGVNSGDAAVPLPTTQRALGVSAGACHSVAWDCSGTAFAWGHGGCGRLGLGGLQHRRSPTQVDALREPVFMASCGANFTLFATSHGRALWACGGNQYGQLGLGDVSSSPMEVPQQLDLPRGSEEIISLACGMHHALCLTRLAAAPGQPMERSVAWAWGCAVSGQCGRAAGERRGSAPPQCRTAPEPLVDFLAPSPHWPLAVAAGRSHSAVLAQTRPSPAAMNGLWCASPPGLNGAFSNIQQPLSPVPVSPSPPFDNGSFQPFGRTLLPQHAAERETAAHKRVVHEDIIDQFCASLAPSTAAPSGHSSTRTADFQLSSPTPQVLMQSPASSEPVLERVSGFVPDARRRVTDHPEGVLSRTDSPLRSPTHGMMLKGEAPAAPGSPGIAHPFHGQQAKGPSTAHTMPPRDRLRRSMSEVALLVELGEAVLRGEDEDESVGPSQNGWDEKEMAQPGEHFWDQNGMVRSASAAQLRAWNGKTYVHGGRSGKPAKTSNPPSRRVSMDLEDRRPKTVVTGVRGRATVSGLVHSGQHGGTDRRKQRWPAAPQSWSRPEEGQRAPRRSASAVELQRSRGGDSRNERFAGYAHGNGSSAAARASRRAQKSVCACGNQFMPDSVFCRKCGTRRPSLPVTEEQSHAQMPFGSDGAMPGSPYDPFADFPPADGPPLEVAADVRKNLWQASPRTASPPPEFAAGRWSHAQSASPPAELSAWQWPAAQLASPCRELPVGQWPAVQGTPQFVGAGPVGFSPVRNPFAEPRRDEWSGVRDSLNDLTSMIANMKTPGSGGLGTGLSFGLTGSLGGGFGSTLSMEFGAGVTNGTAQPSKSRRAESDDETKSPPQQVDDGDASDAGIIFSQTESDAAGSSRRSSARSSGGSRRGAVARRRQNGRGVRAGRAHQRDAPKKDTQSSDRSGAARKSPQSNTNAVSASGSPDLGFMVTQPAAVSPRPELPRAGTEAEVVAEKCRECGTVFIPESNFCMKCGSRRPAKTTADVQPVTVHPVAVSPASVIESNSPSEARFVEPAAPATDAGGSHVRHEHFTSSRAHTLHTGAEAMRAREEADHPAPVQEAEPFVMGAPLARNPSRLSSSGGSAAQRPRSNAGSSAASASFAAPESPAHQAKHETHHSEGLLGRAKHGLTHMLHLGSEKQEPAFHTDVLPSSHEKADVAHQKPSLVEDIRHDGLVHGSMHWIKDHMPGHAHKPAEVHTSSTPVSQDAHLATSNRKMVQPKGSSRTPSSASASSTVNARRKPTPPAAAAPRMVEPVKQTILPARSEQMRSRLSSENSSSPPASLPTSPMGPAGGSTAPPVALAESAVVASQILNVKSRQPRTPSVRSASSVDVSSHHSKAGKPMQASEPTAVMVQPQRQFSADSSADSSSPSPRKPAQFSRPQPLQGLSANEDSSEEEAVQPMVLSAHGSSSDGDSPRRMATAVHVESPRHSAPRMVKPAAESPRHSAPRMVKPAPESPRHSAPRMVKPAAPAEDVVAFSAGESSGESSSGAESLSPQEKLKASMVAKAAVHATTSVMNVSDGSSSSPEVQTRGVQPRRDASPSGSSTGGSSDDDSPPRKPAPNAIAVKPAANVTALQPVSPGSGSSSGADSSPVAGKRPAAKFAPAAPKPAPTGPPIGAPPAGLRAAPPTVLQSFSSGEDLDVEDISD